MTLTIRVKLVLVVLIFICGDLAAQQGGEISGRVLSQEKKPIEFVHVSIKKLGVGVVTDRDGRFVIQNIPEGDQVVHASLIGFGSESRLVTLNAGEHIQNLEIILYESDQNLSEVVVTGTMKEVSKLDSPVPVEVYSANFFRANPTPSVFESMQNINGVRPQINCNVCNTGDIHINGLEGPYTMVMIDGMPIVSGLSTVYGLTGIPQSLIDRVEVVKGPASTLYGSEAVGD